MVLLHFPGPAGAEVAIQYTVTDLGLLDGYVSAQGFGVNASLNTLLDPSVGWLLESAIAINDSGQIAG